MSGKKELSIDERFDKLFSKSAYKSNQVVESPFITTSESQLKKAAAGLSQDFNNTINQVSEESQTLQNFKLAKDLAIEQKKAKKEEMLNVAPGSLDEEVKKDLKTDKAFIDYKQKEEERNKLKEKGWFERFSNTIAQQGLNKSVWTNPISAFANFIYSDEEIYNSVGKPTLFDSGRNKEEQKKYDDLNKVIKKTIEPSVIKYREKQKKKEKEQEIIVSKLNKDLAKANEEFVRGRTDFGMAIDELKDSFLDTFFPDKSKAATEQARIQKEQINRYKKIAEDRNNYKLALEQTNKLTTKLNDFIEGNTSAWSGLGNNWREYRSVGFNELFNNVKLYQIVSKDEKNRTDAEKEALLAYGELHDLEKKNLFEDNFWYRAGDGAGNSLVFMEATLLTMGAGGFVESGTAASLRGITKKVIESSLKTSLRRKIGIALTKKVIPSLAGTAASAALSPTTYSAALKQKIGDVEIVEDKDGTRRVVTSDVAYKQFMKEYDLISSEYEHAISKLESKQNLSTAEEQELEALKTELADLTTQKESLRPKSWRESLIYGYTETLKEFASEKYVGKLVDRGISKIGASTFGKTVASKMPFKKTYKTVKEFTEWGKNYVNNTSIGKISSKAAYHTGANQIYNGLPGEMIEEIAVQVTPTYREENFVSEYLNQLEELGNPSFYADVVGQTLIMSGGTTAVGAVGSAVNYRKRKKFYDARKSIREAYKNIDKAVTDEDLAETILMASAGTVFNRTDYDSKIKELREKNTEESNKAADNIEQKKFTNMALKAIQTNTLDEFEKALDKISSDSGNRKFGEDTVKNIQLAKAKISELKRVHETYANRSNIAEILDLAYRKIGSKQAIEQIDAEILTQKTLANEAYQNYLDSINKDSLLFDVPTDIDTLLNAEGTTAEEESELDKFTKALEETNDPAIQTYVNLLAAKDNYTAARRLEMNKFNEAVSPQYELNLQKSKAVARQFQSSIRYIEQNNITDAGVELDSEGKVILNDTFIDRAFLKLDTMGLPKEKVEAMKDDLKKAAKVKQIQRQQGSFKRISILYEYAKSVNEEKLLSEDVAESPFVIEEIETGTLFPKYVVKNTKNPNEQYEAEDLESAQKILSSVGDIEIARQDAQNNYTRKIELVKKGLYHPITLESDELIDEEYFDTVNSAAPVILEEFEKTGQVSQKTIETLFDLNPGVIPYTLSKVITENLSPNIQQEDLDVLNNTLDSLERSAKMLQDIVENIVGVNTSTTTTVNSNESSEFIQVDSDDLDPLSFDPSTFGPEQIKKLAEFALNTFAVLKDTTGKEPTFKDLVYYYIRFVGKEKAQKSFDIYKISWEAANLPATNYQEVFDEIFEPGKKVFLESQAYIDSLLNITPTVNPTVDTVIESTNKTLQEVEKAEVKQVHFNEENVPVKTSNNRRISGTALRLGFNAIKYDEVEILDPTGKGTGKFQRVAVFTDTLNYSEGLIDFRELLDPDKYNPGDTINVGMVPESEWANIRVYIGRDTNNKPVTRPYAEIFEEKLALDPNYRNSEEFMNTVPVVAYNNQGQPVAYIHETSWYNIWNVSDPSKPGNTTDPLNVSMSHKEAVDTAQKDISNFRKAIIAGGVKKVTIKEKTEGPFYNLADKTDEQGQRVDLINLNEANPQCVIAVQGNQSLLETGVNTPFENEKRVILNKEFIQQNGRNGAHWNLRRIGVDAQGRETWRAFLTTSYKNSSEMGKTPMEEIETVRWAWSAYSFFDNRVDPKHGSIIQDVRNNFVKNTPYDLTEVQAREIIKQIKEITGYNLLRFQDANEFFSLFFHPKTKIKDTTNAGFGKQIYTSDQYGYYLNISRPGLTKNPIIPMISNGVVTSTKKTYQEYLKDKLTTPVRSFNIGTPENPNYVTSIQPTITFEYDIEILEEEQTPEIILENNAAEMIASTQEIKEKELTVNELLEEVKKTQQDLGFKDSNFLASPSTMRSVESLKDMFNLTPGLDIAQEAHLIDFVYNFINNAIDVKYNSKVNKEKLLKDAANSYNEIVSPAKEKITVLLNKLLAANEKESTPEIREAIASLNNMLRVFDNIENNWNITNIKAVLEATNTPYTGQIGIVEKVMEEVSKTSDIKEKKDDLEEEENEEDVTMRVKSFEDNASLTESGKNKTSYRLRRFMSGIKRKDSNGNDIKGFLGLPSYINYNEVYDALYQLLGSGIYIEANYQTMRAKIMTMEKAQPWVKELMEKFDKADEQLRNELVVNYRKHAVAMKFTMYRDTVEGTRLQVYDTNANEVTRVIVKEWENNFKTTPLVKIENGQYNINKEVAKALLDQYQSWDRQGFNQDDTVIRDWLSNFGIKFSDGYWTELKQIGFTYQNKNIPYNQIFEGNNVPIGLLAKYLQSVLDISDTDKLNFEENEKAHPFKDMQSVLKALSKGESRYTGKILSKNFRDGGKNISGITNPTFVTDRIDDLIRAASSGDMDLINTLQSISISSNSILLELLQREPDFYKKLEANYLGITAIKEFGKEGGLFSSITDLNSLDHDITKLGMFQDTQQGNISHRIGDFTMRIGRMFLPTMSDKSQMLTISTGVFNFMAESEIAFTKDEGGNIKFTEDLRNLLFDKLILPEMKRISNFHKNVKATDIKDYDNAAQVFNFFPALNMLTDENGDRIIQHLVEKSPEEITQLYKQQLIDVVENTLHSLAAEKMELLSEFKELNANGKVEKIKFFDSKYLASGTGTLEEKFEIANYDFVINSVLANADMFTVLAGDPALFSQDKLFKEVDQPYFATNDNFYTNLAQKQGINIGKRLALLIAPGRSLAESANKTYKQIFLKDAVDITENAEYLINLFEGEKALNKPLFENSSMTVKEALEEYKTADITRKAVLRKALKTKFENIGDYFDIESTDAQEYTTLKEHLYVLYHDGKIPQEKYKELLDKANEGIELTKEDLGLVLQPVKPVYTGQIFDKDENGKVKSDVARIVYIKSSSFPLIPQLTAGTKLDNLRVSLEELETKHGVPVRASYQTANKVGAKVDSQTIDPLNTESLKNIETAMLTLNRKDFRIQQDVPFKSDLKKEDKIAMGTQIFKLLFGDGVIDLKGFSFNGKNNLTGKDLYDEYNRVFTELIQNKKQSLFAELGLDKFGVPVNEQQTMMRLQNLLQKEAISRDYPIQDVRSLGFETLEDKEGNTYFDFKIPLWLTTNSDRFESLLNAIVTNRLMKHKMPGNSFVAASENGFTFKEDLSGINKSRVIYLDNFNGKELQGAGKNPDGSYRKAQVLVPSKFKNKEGKLIDLFEKVEGKYTYLEKRENGTWKLKDGMIDTELLNQFTFRIPTSSHVSASSIEIAGILPPEVGDLIVTPKNFTKQMGQDFDVDKLNTYQLHHILDFKTGKIEVLSPKHKNRATSKLRKLLEDLDLEKIKLQRQMLPEEVVEFLGKFGNEEQIDLAEYFDKTLLEEVIAEEASVQEKFDKLEREFNLKLLENDFIKIHTAVFNNPSNEMQNKINKVLSMDFARHQADLIQELTSEGDKYRSAKELQQEGIDPIETQAILPLANTSFTILSDEYQKKKMGLGSAGKMAIGIYSNYVTFHSLVQQTPKSLNLREEGEEGMVNKNITIGGLTSNGRLGNLRTLDNNRSIAEVFAERQNTATDNEKEQILGRVNINNLTIGVDSLLTLLGFDQINSSMGPLSVSYALLSQPIIKDYVELMQKSTGISAEFKANLEEFVNQQLFDKYRGDLTEEELSEISGKDLTGENLLEGITTKGANAKIQLAALMTFMDLNTYAKNIAKVQSVLFTDNLGKSMVESNLAYESLTTFSENKLVSNVSTLIGDFIPISEDTPKSEDYVILGDYYVKPLTPQGQIVVEGLNTGQLLWSDFFPYNDPSIKSILNAIAKISGKEDSSKYTTIENNLEILKEIKKYAYSWKGLGLYSDTTSNERKRLFISDGSNTSLAEYLNSNSQLEELVNNKLLNRFTYQIELDGRPSLIKYNNTISDNLEEKYLYNSLAELMLEDKPLPSWNNKPFSTRQLAQELINYSYLEGGIQQAIQFIKYVPIEYLNEIGIETPQGFVSAANMMQRLNTKRDPLVFNRLLGVPSETNVETSPFITQYFQHNPEKAPSVPAENLTFEKEGNELFYNSENPGPKFISIRNKTKSKLKQDKYSLYMHVGGNVYNKISVLGIHGMNEYQASVKNATSIIDKKVPPAPQINSTVTIAKTNNAKDTFNEVFDMSLGTVQNNSSASDVLKAIANSATTKSARHKVLAQILLPFANINTKVFVADTKNTFGIKTSGVYNPNIDKITIDSGLSSEKKEAVFIHELVHAITLRDLKKYYEVDTDGFHTILKPTAPNHVRQLDSVWRTFINSVDPSLREIAKEKTLKLRANIPTIFTLEEKNIGYPTVDIFEFLAIAMESEDFLKYLNTIKLDNNETLLDKFINAITTILSEIGIEINKGSLAEKSLNEILNFIQVEAEMKQESSTFVSTDIDITEDEQQMYEEALNREDVLDNIEEVDIETPDNLDTGESSNPEDAEINLFPYTVEIDQLGITEEEWNNLTSEEQQKIKDCN